VKRFFSESPQIVSGFCESLKTASTYKNRILEQLRTQLGVNPFRRKGVPSGESPDAADAADEEQRMRPDEKPGSGGQHNQSP
jgi:hypothetical protein